MLHKKDLVESLRRASHGKAINMALVEDQLQQDRERRRLHKAKWRRRWRLCCCSCSLVCAVAIAVLVVIFAISAWTQLCEDCGWAGRAYFGAVVTKDKRIILAGGRDGSRVFADVWSGNLKGQDWTRLVESAAFGPRHGHALLYNKNGGDLYVLGGDAGGMSGSESLPLHDVWHSTDARTWVQQTAAAPWVARKNFGAILDEDGRLYVMGGLSGHGSGGLNDVWRSDDKGVTWQAIARTAPWSGRHSFSLVRLPGGKLKGHLYLIGGMDGFQQHDVWLGKPDASSWELARFTHPREMSYEEFKYFASWEPRSEAAAAADSKGMIKLFAGRLAKDGPEGFFSREAFQLPSPQDAPDHWWEKQNNDDRLNLRRTPLEWDKNADPPWKARSGLQTFVDPDDDTAFVLGGEGQDGFRSDLWKESTSINFNNLYSMLELFYLRVAAR